VANLILVVGAYLTRNTATHPCGTGRA